MATQTTNQITSTPKRPPTLKSRLRSGETLYGMFLFSSSPTLAEIAALAGYDFVIVDMEHGPAGISEALSCIRAVKAGGAAAIIRVPESIDHSWAMKALDLGPQGIMFPMIESAHQAQEAVSCCRFRPDGIRGSAFTLVRASNYGLDDAYLKNYAEQLLIMCQVESVKGVKNIEEIVAVEGVDCVQMGPRDLSSSMGYLHDRGNPKVKDMLCTAEQGVLKLSPSDGGAYLGGIATQNDKTDELMQRGYNIICGGIDVDFFRNALVGDLKNFKKGLVNKVKKGLMNGSKAQGA